MDAMKEAELKLRLTKLASKQCLHDAKDFSILNTFGDNIDDAYYGGQSDGEILMAQELLADYFS